MTLGEFLSPVARAPHRAKVLAALYYNHRYSQVESMTADELKKALVSARLPAASKINVADVLARSAHLVDTSGVDGSGRRLWYLTTSGDQEVRGLLGLPQAEAEVEHDVGVLTQLLPRIKDADTKDFAEEAIKCLQAGLLRPAVVFLWSGAVLGLRSKALSYGVKKLNSALQKFDSKTPRVSSLDHFAYVKDSTLILALQELTAIDKGQRITLEEALDLRNRCGHPTKYRPGVAKVSSFIEDVVGIVF